MSLDILHAPGDTIERYERELWGEQAEAQEPSFSSGGSGGSVHEPLQVVGVGPDTARMEREQHEKDKQEAEAVRKEERERESDREKREREEHRNQREEEKQENREERERQERENREERERQEREGRESREGGGGGTASDKSASTQSTIGPVRHMSSRTSGGTGRR